MGGKLFKKENNLVFEIKKTCILMGDRCLEHQKLLKNWRVVGMPRCTVNLRWSLVQVLAAKEHLELQSVEVFLNQ